MQNYICVSDWRLLVGYYAVILMMIGSQVLITLIKTLPNIIKEITKLYETVIKCRKRKK